MSSSLPNSESKNTAPPEAHGSTSQPGLKEHESQAVQTFAFDVSAGRKARAEDAGLAPSVVPAPKLSNYSQAGEADDAIGEGVLATTKHSLPIADERASPDLLLRQVVLTPAAVRPKRRNSRRSAWWVVSLGVHALLLFFLAFTTLVVLQEEDELELYTSPAIYEIPEEFEDLAIDSAEELYSLTEDINEDFEEILNDPDPDALAELSQESLLEELTLSDSPLGDSASEDMKSNLNEISLLFGENGSGMSSLESELGAGAGDPMAKFFGTEVKARRILYILDNSGGMLKSGKFESLVNELQASIGDLQPKQMFYVIFYSDTVYPLFYPHSVRKFIRANDRNRKQLQRWLETVELCTGNAIDEALAAAEVIRPEAVFLLTDGNLFTTEKKRSLLLNRLGRTYPIHTFGLGVSENSTTADRLKQVAEANDGKFRAIKVSNETKILANEKQRPYHNKKPGRVWGLKVGTR